MRTRDKWCSAFERALPRIDLHAHIAFRDVRCLQMRADLIAEAIGLCWRWWVRLKKRGKRPEQFVSVLAGFAVRAVRSGRRVCGMECARDALNPITQKRRGFTVERLPATTRTGYERLYSAPHGQQQLDVLEERLRDNTQTPVPDQVQFRLDFPAWLNTQRRRERRIIEQMMLGERTQRIARAFHVSEARVSQLRREFKTGWDQFTGTAA